MVDKDLIFDRFAGCLLAGAAGDALGYPIEFWSEAEIDLRFGVGGIQTLVEAAELCGSEKAHFSDDTQMTLFTAAGLTRGATELSNSPLASDVDRALLLGPAEQEALQTCIWQAYLAWLATQGDESRLGEAGRPWFTHEPLLNHRRAPGNTCLSALQTSDMGGRTFRPVNHSKGCGGVMRVAPVGLFYARALAETHGVTERPADAMARPAARVAAEAAALTHGHPLGWLSAAALGAMVSLLCGADCVYDSLYTFAHCVLHALDIVRALWPDEHCAKELDALVREAYLMALHGGQHTPENDRANIHRLGEGWVGEEALAIAVYAALAHYHDIAAALRCAVNHGGDADSTGAICGNLLGAFWGAGAVREALDLEHLEGVGEGSGNAGLLESVAHDLAAAALLLARTPAAKAGESAGLPGASYEAAMPDLPCFANPPAVQREGQRCTERPTEDVGMPYTPATRQALELSFAAHRDQRDKAGMPYVYHPFHLADQMRDEASACAALLHDVVEDGHLTFAQLEQAGIPQEAVEAVRALTHDPDVPYMRYVQGLRTLPVAREVKLADLRHNANIARLDHPTASDRRRRMRYLIAQAVLDDSCDRWDEGRGLWRKRIPLDDKQPWHTYYLSVFYRPDGTWDHLSLEEELASDSHYQFDACQLSALDRELGAYEVLPEMLSDALERGGILLALQVLRKLGISYLDFHYD